MKRLGIMIGALALVLGMSQCRKPVETINAAPQGETVDVTLSVTSGADKTEITSTGAVTWKTGDKLYVVGETDGLLGSVSATAAGDPVLFSGKIKALTEAQTLKFYYVGDRGFTLDGSGKYTFDIGAQDGSLAGIAANNQLMWGKIDDVAVGTTDLGTISMTSFIAIAHFNIHNTGGNAVKWVAVDKKSPQKYLTSFIEFNPVRFDPSISFSYTTSPAGHIDVTFGSQSSTDCYIALLPGTTGLSFSCGGAATEMEKTIVANTFYNAGSAVTVSVEEVAYLPGEFSVGASSKVKFSKGNLYWDGTDSKWKFESNQWDYCVNNIQEDEWGVFVGTWNPSHVSHFYWSKSAEEAVKEVFNEEQSMSPEDVFFTNADETTANPDFQVNGETGTNQWRTLSRGEWDYLLNTSGGSSGRTDANRFAKAKVNGVRGLLIFPDGYTLPEGYTTAGGGTGMAKVNKTSSSDAPWPDDNIPTDPWASMETAGVVFLPAVGNRNETVVTGIDSAGYGWSSTPDEYTGDCAYRMCFWSGNVGTDENGRYGGYSVRLVRSAS